MSTTTSPSRGRSGSRYGWRVVDIVVAAVLGVTSGVIFWVWDLVYGPVDAALAFLAPLSGLMNGMWLFAGVIGGLVVRKPGAALFAELVAAFVELALGNQFGFSVLVWGGLQGLGAEVAFALFAYRRYGLPVALLSGALSGVAVGLLGITLSYGGVWETGYELIYLGTSVVSGILVAGLLSYLAVRGLARTGALSSFAAGRDGRLV